MQRLSHRAAVPQRRWPVKELFRGSVACSDSFQAPSSHDRLMADFLVVLGIIAFAVFFLGLIWALDRV
jgi:hypothetical protein